MKNKTKIVEGILNPFIQIPFLGVEVVTSDNAIKAMLKYGDLCRGIVWTPFSEELPEEYENVLYWQKDDTPNGGFCGIGYFVPSQTKIPSYITHWMKLPTQP